MFYGAVTLPADTMLAVTQVDGTLTATFLGRTPDIADAHLKMLCAPLDRFRFELTCSAPLHQSAP